MLKAKSSLKSRIVTKDITFTQAFALRCAKTIDAIKLTFCNLSNRGFGTVLMLAVISIGLVLCCSGCGKTEQQKLTEQGLEAGAAGCE